TAPGTRFTRFRGSPPRAGTDGRTATSVDRPEWRNVMAEPTTPNPDVESTETAFHGEKELESMRRWSDHEPGFPAGTGPLGKPEEWELPAASASRGPGPARRTFLGHCES